jgi:hypothetical protein
MESKREAREVRLFVRMLRTYVHELADEWFGIYGGHAHLRRGEMVKALFDAFAGAYLILKFFEAERRALGKGKLRKASGAPR